MMSISQEWICWLQTYVRAPHLVSRYANRLYLRSLQIRHVSCSRFGQQAPWNLVHEHSSTVVHSGTVWSQIPPQCDHLASKRKLVSSEFWGHKNTVFLLICKNKLEMNLNLCPESYWPHPSLIKKPCGVFSFFWDQLLVIMEKWTKLGLKQEKKPHGAFTFIGSSVIKHDQNMQDLISL